jgi:hypothetical protein
MKKRHVVPFVVALLAVSALLAFTSPNTPSEAPAAVAVAVLSRGDQAGMEERKNYRIQSAAELAYFWLISHGENGPPVPLVDFEAHDVLAVFEGLKPSGGYEITVAEVVDGPSVREVTIRHVEPGASCITTSVITSPFELVVVPKNDAPIRRTDLTHVTECE